MSDLEKTELANSKVELVSLREKRMEGVLLRSRARWIADGEKITSYFCSLENRNYVNKRISKLDRNGTIITNEKDIATEVNHFYSNLYSGKEVEQVEINDIVHDLPTLTEDEQISLEGEITLEEASLALKNGVRTIATWTIATRSIATRQ